MAASGLLAAALVVATASPATSLSLAVGVAFTRTPAVGPNQATVSVSGTCFGASTATVTLGFPVRSDALRPPLDSRTVSVGQDGNFSTPLAVNYATTVPAGTTLPDPVELEVSVSCGSIFKRQPFTMTNRGTTNPTLFIVPADGPCGFGLAPSEAEARIPCVQHVKGLTAAGGFSQTNFYAEDHTGRPLQNGGNIAVGHLDDDRSLDVVTGSLPGARTTVNVTGQQGTQMIELYPYDFTGGASVAVADVDGDGDDDIITGAGPGGGPHVKVISEVDPNTWAEPYGFYAYDPNFRGGVTVAAADLDGDGKAEIITGAGPGGGPHVRVFKADGTPVAGFMAYDPNFHGGVFVAGAASATPGRSSPVPARAEAPTCACSNGSGLPAGEGGFMAYDPAFGGGVAVAVGSAGIVTVPARGGGPHVRTFTDEDGAASNGGFMAYDLSGTGLRVAAAR